MSDPLESFWTDLSQEDKVRLYEYHKYQQTNFFSEVPNEVFTIIMKNLKDYGDFISMMGVCTKFRALIQTNELIYAPNEKSTDYEDIKWYAVRFMFRAKVYRDLTLRPMKTIVPSRNERWSSFRKPTNARYSIRYCKYTKVLMNSRQKKVGTLTCAQPERCIQKGTRNIVVFKEKK